MKVTAGESIGEDVGLLLAELDEALPVFIFYVDDAGARRLRSRALKENCLGGEILFHRAVVVEMIAREIGKDGDVEGNAVNALLLERMGGDFHHRFGAAAFKRAREELIQFKRFGRGVRGGKALVLDAIFDGADQCGLTRCRAQHGIQQE